MMEQENRNKLIDYWKEHEITKEKEYAILTNIIYQEWSGLSVREHKQFKGLKSQSLRDHMSGAELIFTALAELSTRQVQKIWMPKVYPRIKKLLVVVVMLPVSPKKNLRKKPANLLLPMKTIF